MFLIFAVAAFVYLAVRFFVLSGALDWCFEKIVASLFFSLAIPSLFICVIFESAVFALLPPAFVLVAIDLLGAKLSQCRAAERVRCRR